VTTTSPPGFLFLGGARPIRPSIDIGGLALTQARARGFRTHLTNSAAALAQTTQVTRLADAVSAVDPENPRDCVRWACDRRAQGEHFDVVLGLRDQVVLATAEVAAALGAVGNPPEVVRRVRNKDLCRAALAAAGFHQPAFRLCSDVSEAAGFLRETSGPWVVKPRDMYSSMGVQKVYGIGGLGPAIAALPTRGAFLVEEFVDGPEFSVEGVFLSGKPRVLAVTAKEKFPLPYFVEAGHVLPADRTEDVREEISRQAGAALTALGLRFGLFHVELWLTEHGVVLGEVHARAGGDWIHKLLGYAIPGLELFGLIFDDVLSRPLAQDLTPTRAAAAFFLAQPPGRLARMDGWEEVTAHPSVLHAELFVEPGNVARPVRDSDDRAGVIVVGAETPAMARDLAGTLTSAVRFVVE
jgi:hypothetical protein